MNLNGTGMELITAGEISSSTVMSLNKRKDETFIPNSK
jgi:hypothetical protein